MQQSPAETTSNVEDSSSVYTVKCGVPPIKHLWQFCQNSYYPQREQLIDQITAWCIMNPDKEHIYKIELSHDVVDSGNTQLGPNHGSWLTNCAKSLQDGETMNCVVAGSYALWTLEKMFNNYKTPSWKANDIDMFIMNRKKNARHSPSGGLLDIVHTTDKTPEEVVSNFDLPCCRVAFDMNYTFYVSIHVIYALITKKIKLPLYLKESDSFKKVLKRYETNNDVISKPTIETYHNMLVSRMGERIKKYQSRGFSFQWYETDYILPWIKQRFSYVDFEAPKEPLYVPPPKKEDEIPEEFKHVVRSLNLKPEDMKTLWCGMKDHWNENYKK